MSGHNLAEESSEYQYLGTEQQGETSVALPQVDNAIETVAQTTDTSILNDSNFILVKNILENPDQMLVPTTLQRLFDAMLQIHKSHPGNEMALTACVIAVELCQPVLPNEPFPVLKTLQNVVLNVPCATSAQRSTVPALSLQLIHILWDVYKEKLSAFCDLGGLALMLNRALDVGSSQKRDIAFGIVGDVLQSLLISLSEGQLKTLNEKGVYRYLRVLMKYHNDMNLMCLKKAVLSIYIFSCISPSTDELLAEGFVDTFLSVAEKVWSENVMQDCVCRILSVHCREKTFFEEILNQHFLLRASNLLQQKCFHGPLFKFLFACIGSAPDHFSKQCLENEEFMQILFGIINPASIAVKEDVESTVKFLTLICKFDSPKVFEYKLVKKIEECAEASPLEAAVWGCRALAVVAESLCPHKSFQAQLASIQNRPTGEPAVQDQSTVAKVSSFFEENHHIFLQHLLSHPDLCTNPDLLIVFYETLLNLVIASPQDAITRMCSKEFMEFIYFVFVRDTILFPELAASVANCVHIFLIRIVSKEELVTFCNANFHAAVVNLLEQATTDSTRNAAAHLLKGIVTQYNKILNNFKPLLECQVLKVVLNVLKNTGCVDDEEVTYTSHLLSALLTLSNDKAVSQEFYAAGFLDNLVEMTQQKCSAYVFGMLTLIIGSVAYADHAGHTRQLHLTATHKFHLALLQTIKSDEHLNPVNTDVLYSCMATLTILACTDTTKDDLVAGGCISAVTSILDAGRDNLDICSDCLNLLWALASSPLVEKQLDIKHSMLKTVLDTLKTSLGVNEKVRRAAASIVLSFQEDEQILAKISELGVVGLLMDGQQCKDPRAQQCCSMVIDRQLLYMVSIKSTNLLSIAGVSPPVSAECKPSDSQPNRVPNIPKAPILDDTSVAKLVSLGINMSEPVLRIGRVLGIHVGECHSCQRGEWFEEIGIQTQGLTIRQYQSLIDKGWFRRGGIRLYHSSRCHDVGCTYWETKVSVRDFNYHSKKSYAKVLKRIPTGRLTIETRPTHFSQEAYELYNKYNIGKHAKSSVSEKEYCEHAVDSLISNESADGIDYGTFHQLYRLDGKLVAVGLIDIVPKGIVSLYMWYSLDKEVCKYSLGVYSALKEIEMVQELSKKNPEMKYYYLQGWAEGNKKLEYKSDYKPEEFYCACVTPEWLPSMKHVKEAKHRLKMNVNNTSTSTTIAVESGNKTKNVPIDVLCSAFEKDRTKYESLTGHKSDVGKMVVCLNRSTYMHLCDLFSALDMDEKQREVMEHRFEEILVSMDPVLGQNIVVDLKAVYC